MMRLIFTVVFVAASAIYMADFLNRNPEVAEAAVTAATDTVEMKSAQRTARAEQRDPSLLSGEERIRRDRAGHYSAEFRINNQRVDGLIDTGASSIAINETTARRAGIQISPSDFIYTVETANGQARAARAVIQQVSIGSIKVQQVEAIVMEDRALNGTLIGMSFMNRLRGFEFDNGSLILRR